MKYHDILRLEKYNLTSDGNRNAEAENMNNGQFYQKKPKQTYKLAFSTAANQEPVTF